MAKFLIGKEKPIKQSHTTQTDEPEKAALDVVSRVRKALPQIAATLPQELQIKPLFDQSVFVSSALDGVMREGIIAGRVLSPIWANLRRVVDWRLIRLSCVRCSRLEEDGCYGPEAGRRYRECERNPPQRFGRGGS
jgi:hypothetical protein